MTVWAMNLSPRRCAAFVALLLAAPVGCIAPLHTSYLSASRQEDSTAIHPPMQSPVSSTIDPVTTAVRKATAATPPTQEEAFASVLDQLEEIRAIDPKAEEELLADLKQAKPEFYPLIVQQFRAALAYRQQLAERKAKEAKEGAETQLACAVADDHEDRAKGSAGRDPAGRSDHAGVKTASGVAGVESSSPQHGSASTGGGEDADPSHPAEAASAYDPPAKRLAERSAATAPTVSRPEPPPTAVATAAALDRQDNRVSAASYTPTAASGNWRDGLNATIADFERNVSPQPTTVAEVHDYMRLRTLQLLAGREEDAYRPIPGASPAEQDYWSKQLFAMAAYLSDSAPMDDKQRAAAALLNLDEARGRLSELATLQIRNLEFVASVDGFGAYKPLKDSKFKPGEKVKLYAEVENFRSQADKDGFQTSLATSYQVLDESGHRVEGGQFPDVSDVCRNRRRDFHMQYGVTLPARIYPGTYQIELTITDHNSNKIGQSKLRFEIVGER